jgi:hypothetical protein
VDAILQAKTGQLHPEKVGDWCDRDAIRRSHGRREGGEQQMHRAAGPPVRGVHEHIGPCRVPISKTVRSNGVSNPVTIGTRDGDIDVSCQSRQERVHALDVQEDTEPANHPIRNASVGKRFREPPDDVDDLFHASLEVGVGQHHSARNATAGSTRAARRAGR